MADKETAVPGRKLEHVLPTRDSLFLAPPDGGMAAWLVILGAWCTSFCSFGWINSVGVFQQYYKSGPLQDYSSSTISWIPSLQIFFMMAMGPFVGKVYDSFGSRSLLFFGSFLHVFGMMMASISHQYYQLLLSQGVCSAIGVSAIFQPALNSVPHWFAKKAGIAYGILATGSSVGGIVLPIMLTRLIQSIGYGWAMRIAAFVQLFLLIIANLTIRTRGKSLDQAAPKTPVRQQLIESFREPGFSILLAGLFVLTFGIFVPITYLPTQAIAVGMSRDLANYLVAILNAGSLFGRLTAGVCSDKAGKYNTFTISCFLAGIFCLALWIPGDDQSSIIAFAVLFGFFSGAYVSLIGALVAQISSKDKIGFRTGLAFLVSALPGLTTSPFAGAIVAHTGKYLELKIFSGIFCIVGALIILAARLWYTGLKIRALF